MFWVCIRKYYDRVLSRPTEGLSRDQSTTGDNTLDGDSEVTLSRDVEDFLNQMGERFENNGEIEDDTPDDVSDPGEESDTSEDKQE